MTRFIARCLSHPECLREVAVQIAGYAAAFALVAVALVIVNVIVRALDRR